MNLQKIPALLLALVLQVLPICRVACVNTVAAPTGFAVVMRWLAGTVALLGSYHAVSGASAAVVGVAQINPTTQLQTGPVTTNARGTNGQTFAYRIIVTNPGVNYQQAFYNAAPLPPGLTVNTNLGANGDILGTPTTPGVYPVTLTAGNANYANVVTTNITITIADTGTASAPSITGPPANQTVPVGTNVSFTVTANGTVPLSYSWTFNGSAIIGATTSNLQLANVVTNSSGTYSVTVANSAGSKSASATLSVMVPPSVATPPQSLTVTNGGTAQFSVVASGSSSLFYQWQFNGNALAGATSSSLTLLNAQGTNQGSYTVVVSNPVGTVTSPPAVLTVQTAASGPFQLSNWVVTNGTWSFDVTGPTQTNIVIWSSTDLSHWTPVSTNSANSGTVHFSSPTTPAVEFYRASLSQ
jgi:hypothetical protein